VAKMICGSVGSQRSLVVACRWMAAYAMLNLPFWIWSYFYFFSRPWFNVELVFPLLLLEVAPVFAYALLLVGWFLDGLVGQAATFYFASPLDFLRSTQFISDVSWRSYVSFERVGVAIPFLLVLISLPYVAPKKTGKSWITLTFVVLLAVVDLVNGSSKFSDRAVRRMDVNVAGSPSFTLGIRSFYETDERSLRPIKVGESSIDAYHVKDWIDVHPDGSVVLILVESLGIHQNQMVRDWLRDQLWSQDLRTRYRLAESEVPFHGSTTDGELRELCGVTGSFRKVPEQADRFNCLPMSLTGEGWTTSGLHGFSQSMFLRSLWWPRIGIQRMLFAQDLIDAGQTSHCGGAFAGTCDSDVIEQGFLLARAPRQFVYVLTLNSHLPLKSAVLDEGLQSVCKKASLQDAECQLSGILAKVLAAARQGAAAAPSDNLPLVVIVGDHAPPFGVRELRQKYSQSYVQSFALIPR
jgi:hypothetical protein